MLICFVLWTICSALYETEGNKQAGQAIVAFIFLYSTSYALAWNGLLIAYTVEILPYRIRAKGLMVQSFFVQAALVFNQYVNPIGLEKLLPQYKFYIVYCCWIAFELVIVYFCKSIVTRLHLVISNIKQSTSRPRDQLSRKLPRSLMARMPRSDWPRPKRSSMMLGRRLQSMSRISARSRLEVAGSKYLLLHCTVLARVGSSRSRMPLC